MGYNEWHDHVQLCDGSGRCDRSYNALAGGLVGYNDGTITSSYATGEQRQMRQDTTPKPAAWWGIMMAR